MTTALSAPRALIQGIDGYGFVPRRMGYDHPEARVFCRRGHEIRSNTHVIDGVAGLVCPHVTERTAVCREVVCVIEGSTAGSFRVDLTIDEWQEIKRRGWRAHQILDYVGAGLPKQQAG